MTLNCFQTKLNMQFLCFKYEVTEGRLQKILKRCFASKSVKTVCREANGLSRVSKSTSATITASFDKGEP